MSKPMASGTPDDPTDLGVQEAIDRFIRKRRTDSTERTLRSYRSRLGQFANWTIANDIATVGEITPWALDEYGLARRDAGQAPATIKGQLSTLRVFLAYLEGIGAVEEGIADSLDVPTLSAADEQSEERLAAEDALAALSFFRDSRKFRSTPMHAFLELAWHTGARVGSIRGLDLGDLDAGDQYVEFTHRPSTETPLKNKRDGERYVGLAAEVVDVLEGYIARERSDKRDEHGREPLFSARQGRLSFSTLRAWSYQATQPCLWTQCPHGRRRATCEWTERTHSSKCPSSRSPHRVRTGSITWQLNQGLSIEIVAERVNASPQVIRRYYDQASRAEEFEERRRAAETALDINNSTDDTQ